MEDLLSGYDELEIDYTRVETSHKNFNYSPPVGDHWGRYSIQLNRKVLSADVKKQRLDRMPGFRYSWHYSGVKVEPKAEYVKAFVRNYSNSID